MYIDRQESLTSRCVCVYLVGEYVGRQESVKLELNRAVLLLVCVYVGREERVKLELNRAVLLLVCV